MLYLTLPMTSVKAEKSFSALKRIKTYFQQNKHQTTMDQELLSSLAIIHIERELANEIDLDIIVDQFESFIKLEFSEILFFLNNYSKSKFETKE